MSKLFVWVCAAALACGTSNSGGSGSTNTPVSGPASTPSTGTPDAGSGPVTVMPPPPAKHHVTLHVSGTGQVRTGDGSLDCPGVCEADFIDGAVISVSASPATGYDPPSFSGACSGKSCSFVIHQDAQISAVFPRTQVTVDVKITGSGTVTSTPSGISCPGRCSASFDYGTDVALVQSPASGYEITALAATCGGNRCAGPLTGDETYSVTFTRLRMLTLVTGGDGNGRVISAPAGIDCPGKCSASFFEGTTVTLAATPDVNSMVASWAGDCTSAPCSIVLRRDATAKLVWRPRRYIARDIGPQYTTDASDARAISRDGRYVTGLSGSSDNIYFWHDGTTWATRLQGYVTGINASGTTCGSTSNFHGFTLSSMGVLTDLGANSYVIGINDAGVAVGYGRSHAVYWPPAGNPVDLGAIDGQYSDATAINSRGVIVGKSSVGAPSTTQVIIEHAARWRAPNVIDDLGTLGGSSSGAAAISENGLIVGSSDIPGDQTGHGFFIGEDGRMVDVGVPPRMLNSRMTGVNSQGTAVGLASDATSSYGIVYRAGRLYLINDLVAPGGFSVWIPTAIAEDGSIAAYGNTPAGQAHGLLLTLEPQ